MNSSAQSPSFTRLPEQLPNIYAMAAGGLRSVLPLGRPGRNDQTLRQTKSAPSARLLDAYRQWAGTDSARFGDSIPPHFAACQMALGMISRLTAQSPYPLLSVVNQGVHLRVNAALPRDGRYTLEGRLAEASDDGYRARIHSHIRMGSRDRDDALIIDAYAAVMLRPRPGKQSREDTPQAFRTIGHWQAAADEGVTFFKLTGDFNPIHTLPLVARRTRFGGCIMHGYGSFVQLYEAVRNAGWDIADIDVRFIRAVPLPSPRLSIQVGETADADGRLAVRMVDDEAHVYQVGHFLPAGEPA